MEIHKITTSALLTGSIGSDNLGGLGGYGGVDENGELEPSSRMLDDLLNEGLGF